MKKHIRVFDNKVRVIIFVLLLFFILVSAINFEKFFITNKAIAYADSEFFIKDNQYDKYTDSDYLLNDTTHKITDYSTLLYNSTSIVNKINSQYNLTATGDDPIVNIIPKELFYQIGNHLYIGREYGFFVNTCKQKYNDDKGNIIYSNHNKKSIAMVFDINTDFNIDRFIVTVKPIFQYEYAYISYDENYFSMTDTTNSDYRNKINYSITDNIVIPLPQASPILGNVQYQEVEEFFLKDISFAAQLFNEQASNDFLFDYNAETDMGAFFTGYDYSYSGLTDENILEDIIVGTSCVSSWLGVAGNITASLPAVSSLLGVASSLIGIPGLIDSTINFHNVIQGSKPIIESGKITATALYTTKAHQIAYYGNLIKKAAIVVNTATNNNLYYGKNAYAEANFTLSNSADSIDTENQTRIVRDIAFHVVNKNGHTIQASSDSSYHYVYGKPKVDVMEIDSKSNVFLLNNGVNYYSFTAPYSSDYNINIEAENIVLKINGTVLNSTTFYLKKGGTYQFQILSNDEIITSEIHLTPCTQINSISLKGNDAYILKIGIEKKDYYLMRTSNNNIKIKDILYKNNGKIETYRFNNYDIVESEFLSIPLNTGNIYIVLINPQSEKMTTNLQVSTVKDIKTGINNNIPVNNNWNYYKFTSSINNYVITFVADMALTFNLLDSNFNQISHTSLSDSILVSLKGDDLYLALRSNKNDNIRIIINTNSNAYKWYVDGTSISGQEITLEKGTSHKIEFKVNSIVTITSFEKVLSLDKFSLDGDGTIHINYDCNSLIQIRALANLETSYIFYLNIIPSDETKIKIIGSVNNETELGFNWQTSVVGISGFTYCVGSQIRTENLSLDEKKGKINCLELISPSRSSTAEIKILSIKINGSWRSYDSKFATISVSTRFGGGQGTENSPFLIGCKRHFNNIKYSNRSYFKQTERLNFDNTATERNVDFYGTYLGNLKGFYNIKIMDNSSIIGGLFRCNYGTITALGALSVDIESTNKSSTIGGIVGINKESATLTTAVLTGGKIIAKENIGGYIGGITGINYGKVISGLVGFNIVSACYMGGVIGDNAGVLEGGIITSTLELCSARNIYMGGIVAVNRGTLSKVTSSVALKYTANSSNSRTLAPYIGFLIGYNNGGKYTECIVKNASLNVGTLHIETWKTGTIFKRVTHTWDQKQNTGRNVAKS